VSLSVIMMREPREGDSTLEASSGRSLAVPPLPSASTCVNVQTIDRIHIQGTFTPYVHAHAGRTQIAALDFYSAARRLALRWPKNIP